jgi:hypothetical protein
MTTTCCGYADGGSHWRLGNASKAFRCHQPECCGNAKMPMPHHDESPFPRTMACRQDARRLRRPRRKRAGTRVMRTFDRFARRQTALRLKHVKAAPVMSIRSPRYPLPAARRPVGVPLERASNSGFPSCVCGVSGMCLTQTNRRAPAGKLPFDSAFSSRALYRPYSAACHHHRFCGARA